MSYYTPLIPDFGLSADQLRDKYSPGLEHPALTRGDWVQELAQPSTLSSYWDWVQQNLDRSQDELDRDNPYNPA